MGYYEDIRRTVCGIPRGKVATYGEVARAAGYPQTARRVAGALRGAEARGIPWQRVLGSGGRILLPAQAGLQQRQLLELEGVGFVGAHADMKHHAFHFPKTSPPRMPRRSRRGAPGHWTAKTSASN